MSSLSVVRKAVADTLSSVIPELSAYDKIVPQINYPGVVVHPEESDFTMAFKRGTISWDLNLLVLVSGLEPYIHQDLLDELVDISGPRSITQAIDNNRDLGLGQNNCYAHVNGMAAYWIRYLSAHYGATIKLKVITRGI